MSESAAARAIAFPVSTSPVSETSRTSGCVTIRSPTGTPSPVTTLSTPAGITSCASSAKRSSDERRLLGRLQHLDVAGRERRRELPDGHHQRVVPRRDPADDPERLAANHRGVAAHVLAARACPRATRAAPAKKRRLSEHDRQLVARVARAACRRSRTRAAPAPPRSRRSGPRASSSISARSPGVVSSHSGSAAFAASTARSTSACAALRHLGDRLSVAGFSTSIVPPDAASSTRRRRRSGVRWKPCLRCLPPRRVNHGGRAAWSSTGQRMIATACVSAVTAAAICPAEPTIEVRRSRNPEP